MNTNTEFIKPNLKSKLCWNNFRFFGGWGGDHPNDRVCQPKYAFSSKIQPATLVHKAIDVNLVKITQSLKKFPSRGDFHGFFCGTNLQTRLEIMEECMRPFIALPDFKSP